MLSLSLVFISFSFNLSIRCFFPFLALTDKMAARLVYVTRRGAWINCQSDAMGGKRKELKTLKIDSISTSYTMTKNKKLGYFLYFSRTLFYFRLLCKPTIQF